MRKKSSDLLSATMLSSRESKLYNPVVQDQSLIILPLIVWQISK